MNISISHSTNFDFEKELYEPILNSNRLKKHTFFLPEDRVKNTREIIKNCDIMIADVSYPSTGTGIEIGWASGIDKPIYCIYKQGCSYSFSLKFITENFYEYTPETLTRVIEKIVEDHINNTDETKSINPSNITDMLEPDEIKDPEWAN